MKPRSGNEGTSWALAAGALVACFGLAGCSAEPRPAAGAAPAAASGAERAAAPDASRTTLRIAATIAMSDVRGRIDHLALDPARDRLFVAALENGTVELIDLAAGRALAPWTWPGEPTGAAWVDVLGRAAIGDAQRGKVWLLDAEQRGDLGGEPASGVGSGADTDNVRWLPKRRILLAAYGAGGLAFVGVEPLELRHTLDLGGHPESFQCDAAEERAWVNVPDLDALLEVDLEKRAVVRKIAVDKAHRNYPMALAEKDGRVLVGCRKPARMLVYDMRSGELTADLPLSGDVDDIFVDDARGLVYAACGEGFVDVFERAGLGAWEPKEKIATREGARTCLFDAASKRLFVALPRRGDAPAELRVYSTAD